MSRLALGPTQPLIQGVPALFAQGYSGWDLSPATYLHLVLRLRMSGAIFLFPLYAFMVWHRQIYLLFFWLKHLYISAKVRDITSQKAAVFIIIAMPTWSLTCWFVLQILHQDALLKPLNMVQQFLTPLSNEDMSQQDNFKERQVSSALNNTVVWGCSPLSTFCHGELYKYCEPLVSWTLSIVFNVNKI
jgi:hypothetical protein